MKTLFYMPEETSENTEVNSIVETAENNDEFGDFVDEDEGDD